MATVELKCTRSNFSHPLQREKTSENYHVGFDSDDDHYHPRNWSKAKKINTTLLSSFITMGSTWATSSFAPAIKETAAIYHVSPVVTTLGTTIMMLGYAIGPLLWTPVCEVRGRIVATIIPYACGAIFAFATGASQGLAGIFINRFFTGFFCAPPVSNVGGVLADIWPDERRGIAMAIWGLTVSSGPLLGDIVGGTIVNSSLSWRWTQYVSGILMSTAFVAGLWFVSETDASLLLAYKARRLRVEKGNWAIHAEAEDRDVSVAALAHKYVLQPVKLVFDPICFLMTIYNSFVYTILYVTFSTFPIVYEGERGWNPLVGSLPQVGTLIGCSSGCCVHILKNIYYVKKLRQNNGRPVPEARLPPMMLGSFFFAVGLFLFVWTSNPGILWVPSVFGAVFIGFGFMCIFQACLNYLIDTFQTSASSAMAANAFVRAALTGAFPLFAPALFHNLAVPWASKLLALIAVAMVPIPFFFFAFGPRTRARGKMSKASTY